MIGYDTFFSARNELIRLAFDLLTQATSGESNGRT